MSVTLIIPALNEAEALPKLAPRLPDWIDQVLIVDNGSKDGTAEVARKLGFDVISVPVRGYGQAVWHGAEAAKGPILAFASADGSDPVDRLSELIAPIQRGEAELSLSWRQPAAGAMNWIQRLGNRLAPSLIHLRWGVRFHDLGPFRALRKDTLTRLDMQDRGFGWTLEMQIKVAARGLRFVELPLPYTPRQAGQSKISGTLKGAIRASLVILWTFLRWALKRQA